MSEINEPRGYIDDMKGDALDLSPVTFDRRLFSDDLIRDLGGDPEAQGLT